jgi:hypothetical protein
MDSLYVCLFSNDQIKVGRTTNLPARIKQHCDRVACVGVVLTDLTHWICEEHVEARERWLIDLCAGTASNRFQNEWFTGLDFNTVRSWARQAAKLEIPTQYIAPPQEDAAAGVHADWAGVESLGPANVARELGVSLQVVQNWKYRGIPSRWKLDRPDLFLPHMSQKRAARKPKNESEKV